MAAMTRIRLLAALALLFAAAAEAADDARVRTVVVGLAARRGVDDKGLAAALSDVVQTAYAQDAARVVIGREEIARVLQWEAERQQAGCDDAGCLAEIGAAMDAARIVTGSIDRIGGSWLVVVTEVDAKTAEPLGRVQEQIAGGEDALVAAVTRLAERLVDQTRARAEGGGFAAAGSVDVASDPRGAQVYVAGRLMGTTPIKIDNLKTGTQKLRVVRADYDPVEVDVPVYPAGTTKVAAEMRIHRSLAEQNYAMRQARADEEQGAKDVRMWTGVGAGGTAIVASAGVGAWNFVQTGGTSIPLYVVGGACGLGGLGLLGWALFEALTPVPRAVPEWEQPRKVTVTPPDGQGDVQVRELNLPDATRGG